LPFRGAAYEGTLERHFSGWASLATMHGKERAIAPILAHELGVRVCVAPGLDTDALGTFTGEIQRVGSARESALAKACLALRYAPDADYGIGSEGSFGPDVQMPFATVGHEVIALVSRSDDLVLFGSDISTQTNCAEAIVADLDDALACARRFGFPEHGAVVMGVRDGRAAPTHGLVKGIVSADALRDAVERTIASCGTACLQSDMRAHVNPTRMLAIARATADLVRSARSRCPNCRQPGYAIIERERGLPCRDCNEPSDLTSSLVYGCTRCQQRDVRARPDGRTTADAAECDRCNP